MAITFPWDWRVGRVTPPIVRDGLALEDCDEDVEGVKKPDNNQEDDDRDSLPIVVDAESENENAHDELDNRRDDNVSNLASPFEDESFVSVLHRDVFNMRTEAERYSNHHKHTKGELKELMSCRWVRMVSSVAYWNCGLHR